MYRIQNLPALSTDASPFSPSERAVICKKLNALLESELDEYARSHPGGMNGAAQETLLRSLLYTLSLHPQMPETFRPLLVEIVQVRLENGRYELMQKRDCALRLAAALLSSLPFDPGTALKGTLRSILLGLQNYDVRFHAHEAAGKITYPLFFPLSDAALGVDYTLQFLLRLSAEIRLLRAFAPHRALALLDGHDPMWRNDPINLAAPLAANTLALTLLGKDAKRLHISSADRQTLYALFALKSKEQLEKALLSAFPEAAKALGLEEFEDMLLLMHAAKSLAPRVYDACTAGDLSRVFPCFGLPRGC